MIPYKNTFSCDEYCALLTSYACGTLDPAHTLLVATHITLSQDAASFVNACECVGGALIDSECGGVAMRGDSLSCVLNKLDSPPCNDDICATDVTEVPKILAHHMPRTVRGDLKWQTLLPGISFVNLTLPSCRTTAMVVRLAPGARAPAHFHPGTEITLVLDGAFQDETGRFEKGSLIICDDGTAHTPVADRDTGCICLIATESPVRFTGWLGYVLNPLLRQRS